MKARLKGGSATGSHWLSARLKSGLPAMPRPAVSATAMRCRSPISALSRNPSTIAASPSTKPPYPTIRRIVDACLQLPAFDAALPQNQPDATR